MTDLLHDDHELLELLRSVRPVTERPSGSWRAAERAALVARAPLPAASTSFVDVDPMPTTGGRRRRAVGAVAAGLAAAAVIGVVAVVAADRDSVSTSDTDPSAAVSPTVAPTTSTVAPSPTSTPTVASGGEELVPATGLVAPGRSTTAEMAALLALPPCSSAGDLATWSAERLSFTVQLDPSAARVTPFADVAAVTPVDTAATGSCTVGLAVGDASAWAVQTAGGEVVARGVSHPDTGDWPELQRVKQGDDGPSWTFGSGQMFNSYAVRTTEVEQTIEGVVSFGPIVVVQLAEPLVLPGVADRLSMVRTTNLVEGEAADVAAPEPMTMPTLVPPGFGQCRSSTIRGDATTDGAVIGAFTGIDFCRGDEVITVLTGADPPRGAVERVVNGQSVLVEESPTQRTIALVGYRRLAVVGPTTVPLAELAGVFASIPLIDPQWSTFRGGEGDLRAWWSGPEGGTSWVTARLATIGLAVQGEEDMLAAGPMNADPTMNVSVYPTDVPTGGTVSGADRARHLLVDMRETPRRVDLGPVDGIVTEEQGAVICGELTFQIFSFQSDGPAIESALRALVADLDC